MRVGRLRGQERVREGGLIPIGKSESVVLREKLVQVRGAIPPVAEDKKWRLNPGGFNESAEALSFPALKETVLQTLDRDGQSARQAGEIDGIAFLPEQLAPLAKGDTTQQPWPNQCEESFPPIHDQDASAGTSHPAGGGTV